MRTLNRILLWLVLCFAPLLGRGAVTDFNDVTNIVNALMIASTNGLPSNLVFAVAGTASTNTFNNMSNPVVNTAGLAATNYTDLKFGTLGTNTTNHAALQFGTLGTNTTNYANSIIGTLGTNSTNYAAGIGTLLTNWDKAFNYIQLPDEQYTVGRGEEAYLNATIGWITSNSAALNLKAVFMPGNLVDTVGSAAEYDYISNKIWTLQTNGLLVVATLGDTHDMDVGGTTHTNWNNYIVPLMIGQTACVSIYSNSLSWSAAYVQTNSNTKILIMGVEGDPGAGVTNWAMTTMAKYSNHLAVALVHSFLDPNGEINEPDSTYYLKGDIQWRWLRDCPNLVQVLCSHSYQNPWARKVLTGNAGNRVDAIHFNTQAAPGPDQFAKYVRLYTWAPAENSVLAQTYHTTGGYITTNGAWFNFPMVGFTDPREITLSGYPMTNEFGWGGVYTPYYNGAAINLEAFRDGVWRDKWTILRPTTNDSIDFRWGISNNPIHNISVMEIKTNAVLVKGTIEATGLTVNGTFTVTELDAATVIITNGVTNVTIVTSPSIGVTNFTLLGPMTGVIDKTNIPASISANTSGSAAGATNYYGTAINSNNIEANTWFHATNGGGSTIPAGLLGSRYLYVPELGKAVWAFEDATSDDFLTTPAAAASLGGGNGGGANGGTGVPVATAATMPNATVRTGRNGWWRLGATNGLASNGYLWYCNSSSALDVLYTNFFFSVELELEPGTGATTATNGTVIAGWVPTRTSTNLPTGIFWLSDATTNGNWMIMCKGATSTNSYVTPIARADTTMLKLGFSGTTNAVIFYTNGVPCWTNSDSATLPGGTLLCPQVAIVGNFPASDTCTNYVYVDKVHRFNYIP